MSMLSAWTVFDSAMMLALSLCFSAFCCLLILATKKWHVRISADAAEGVQKIHQGLIPRIGGVALYSTFAVMVPLLFAFQTGFTQSAAMNIALYLLAALPVFLAGIIEDFTKIISPTIRLIAACMSGVCGWFLGIQVNEVELPFIDSLLAFAPASLILTIVIVAALSNALNMMDGMNGFVTGFSIVAFGIFSYFAHLAGDSQLVITCFVIIGALAGFGLFNWPFARLFLGDGGAYMIGVLLAFVAFQLASRSENITQAFTLVILVYPAWEISFSMLRRIRKKAAMTAPDNDHLHARLYHFLHHRYQVEPKRANPTASFILTVIILLVALLSAWIMTTWHLPQGFKFIIVLVTFAVFSYLHRAFYINEVR